MKIMKQISRNYSLIWSTVFEIPSYTKRRVDAYFSHCFYLLYNYYVQEDGLQAKRNFSDFFLSIQKQQERAIEV
jgi:hypothetical protein